MEAGGPGAAQPTRRPWLIAFSGLPATGKTTVARALALRLGSVYLRIDSIEQAMVRSMLNIDHTEDAGYLAAYAVAADNLRLGLNVVADSVNPLEITRRAWANVAAESGAALLNVEILCADTAQHQWRVETRVTDVEGLRLPTWEDVTNRHYEPWTSDRLVIDTGQCTPDEAVEAILARLG